ncbi:unnamed protein product [Gordionus sp. m RMFG-2023]
MNNLWRDIQCVNLIRNRFDLMKQYMNKNDIYIEYKRSNGKNLLHLEKREILRLKSYACLIPSVNELDNITKEIMGDFRKEKLSYKNENSKQESNQKNMDTLDDSGSEINFSISDNNHDSNDEPYPNDSIDLKQLFSKESESDTKTKKIRDYITRKFNSSMSKLTTLVGVDEINRDIYDVYDQHSISIIEPNDDQLLQQPIYKSCSVSYNHPLYKEVFWD